ncbi:MAG: hypothetical protein ACTSYD_04325 [Candidatus Heimdallarchaeaceae archaeon]
MSQESQPKEYSEPKLWKKIIAKVTIWGYLLIDAFSSGLTVFGLIGMNTQKGCDAIGYACIFIITFPITLVLNALLITVLVIRAMRRKRKIEDYTISKESN